MEENIQKETEKEFNQDKKISLDLNTVDLDVLIGEIENLSLNQNPYSVSKEIENIKSIFYKRLISKESYKELDQARKDTSSKKNTLHPLEIKFKKTFRNYQKIHI